MANGVLACIQVGDLALMNKNLSPQARELVAEDWKPHWYTLQPSRTAPRSVIECEMSWQLSFGEK